MTEGYCMKEKKKVEMINEKKIVFVTRRGNKHAITGRCRDCGTKMFKIVKKEQEAK